MEKIIVAGLIIVAITTAVLVFSDKLLFLV